MVNTLNVTDLSKNKWPKQIPPLTDEQKVISDDFMRYWHEVLANRRQYGLIEQFNHGYVVKNTPFSFTRTLEIGAGLGEHLNYEKVLPNQEYVALEYRDIMAKKISEQYPHVEVLVKDCQKTLPFADEHFDRIIAIHVLEHLPNLPATIKEAHRLCNKKTGVFSIVIPCEGGLAYTLARKISAQRIFERRYKQSYDWFIKREHINVPEEIIAELSPYFDIMHKQFFPLSFLPITSFNLCIGLTLRPKTL